MASTTNSYRLLLEENEVPQAAKSKKRIKKKKGKPSATEADKDEAEPELQIPSNNGTVTVSFQSAAGDSEHEGFQTVVKGSRGKALSTAKTLESSPRESDPLAAQARQEAENQARSPDIQETVEAWVQKVRQGKGPRYVEPGRKALTWKEVLLSSAAVEVLFNTCLTEKVDSSLEPVLADLFRRLAADETAEKRSLADGLASAITQLARSIDPKLPQNLGAAKSLLHELFALLRAPSERKASTPAAPKIVVDAARNQARITELNAQLKTTKPAKQTALWDQIIQLYQQMDSSPRSLAPKPEPAAVRALQSFEGILQGLHKDPAAQRKAARAEMDRLGVEKVAVEKKLQEARLLVETLEGELNSIAQGISLHTSRQEQPVQQISQEALTQQLAIVKRLKGKLDTREPAEAPPPAALSSETSSETSSIIAEAAGLVLCSQIALQREVASKAFQANERLTRKRQQVEQLGLLSNSKDLKTASGQLEAIESEIKRYEADSAKIRDAAQSIVKDVAKAGVAPNVAAEHPELAEALAEQHAKLLDGPLRLQGARFESLIHDVRAPLIGSPVATSRPLQPISRPQAVPTVSPPQDDGVPQPPHYSPVAADPPTYNQWNPATSPVQPAWTRPQAPNFGELLQGSSVSEAPSKVPAPIAPASFIAGADTPRDAATAGLPIRAAENGGTKLNDVANSSTDSTEVIRQAEVVPSGWKLGGELPTSEGSKPKRIRSRNRHKPVPA